MWRRRERQGGKDAEEQDAARAGEGQVLRRALHDLENCSGRQEAEAEAAVEIAGGVRGSVEGCSSFTAAADSSVPMSVRGCRTIIVH